jgi:hypothetical protein
MASTLVRFESSGFLNVGGPKVPRIDNEVALHYCIMDACQTISNFSRIFE